MSAALNKELIRSMWAEAAKGKFEGFLNGYSDDLHYTIIGTTRFSGTFGKQELLERVLVPMMSDLEASGGLEADTLIAEGDYVVVQGHGVGRRTKSGQPYNNTYSIVYKLAAGKVVEVAEYWDTELVTRTFGK
jgi:uncharacterized protein